MGTPYIGHGYLDMNYDPVQKALTTYYALPWLHNWTQSMGITGNATFTQDGGPRTITYEVCYIPPSTRHNAAAPLTLIAPDEMLQATIETTGNQGYGYYLVLVQGYAGTPTDAHGATGGDYAANGGQSYDLLLTRVPKPTGVDTANLQDGPWKYHWGKRLPDDNHDIKVKIASVQTGLTLERWQAPQGGWTPVTDADNLREFGRFRLRGQALHNH